MKRLAPTVAVRVAFHMRRVERLRHVLRGAATMELSRLRLLRACLELSLYRSIPGSNASEARKMRASDSRRLYRHDDDPLFAWQWKHASSG